MVDLELQADLFADDLRTREDGDVLQHGLAALTEARGLDGRGLEGATDLVDDQRRERLTLEVLGDDDQRTAGLHDLLEHGQEVLHGRDLRVRDEDVRVLEHDLHAVGVGHEVRRDVALVELHALDELQLHAERLRLLDGDDAVLADLVHRVGDDAADGRVVLAEMAATWAISAWVSISRDCLTMASTTARRPCRCRA